MLFNIVIDDLLFLVQEDILFWSEFNLVVSNFSFSWLEFNLVAGDKQDL